MTPLEHILTQARELSEEEQAILVEEILEGIHRPDRAVQEKWADLAEARAEEIASGKVRTIPADDVMRRLKERFRDA